MNLGVEISKKLEDYAIMLLEWNKIHSLSGAKSLEMIQKNIEDSLYPLEIESLKLRDKKFLFDVGSGNGFPAIPLGIVLGSKVILCEPNAKKAAFLQNVKVELGLENFCVMRQKVEQITMEDKPDIITSRATFGVSEFLVKCQKNISKESLILLYKGSNVESEIPKDLEYQKYQKDFRNYLVIKGEKLC